jgi:arylsulfatase A-like enzyme
MARSIRWVILGSILALSLFVVWSVRAASPSRRPKSLLLVVVDTLRYDAGDPGGSPDGAVPDFLKSRGTHYKNALAASDWTSPSMVALMTGRYPSDCGLLTAAWTTQFPKEWSLPERLRSAGFRTAAVVSNPTLGGTRLSLQAGFDTFDDKMTGVERNRAMGMRKAPETTDAALAALAALADGKSRSPWFLWVQYLQPHGPYSAPPPYPQAADDPGAPLPTAASDIARRGEIPMYQFLAEARGRNDYTARYRSSAQWSLDEADRFLRTAASKGYLRDVTVVFTADHGEFLGEDDFWFEHGVRLNPAVVRVPLVVARSVDDPVTGDPRPVSHLDLVPTVSRILGLPANPALPGIDLFDARAVRRTPIIVENIEYPTSAEVGVLLRDRFVMKSTDDKPGAFRVDGETWESAGADLTAEQAQAIDAELRRVRKLPVPTREVPPEEIQKLRALGYVH